MYGIIVAQCTLNDIVERETVIDTPRPPPTPENPKNTFAAGAVTVKNKSCNSRDNNAGHRQQHGLIDAHGPISPETRS